VFPGTLGSSSAPLGPPDGVRRKRKRKRMLLCSSQQVVVALSAVLVSVVVLPRMLGVGSGPPDREPRGFDPRHHRRGRLHMDTARHANTHSTQVLIRIPK